MQINISYPKEFERFWSKLKRQYPKELFELEGVGSQLDFNAFSKKFFTNNTTTADVSVDSNSNVSDKSVISFPLEMVKPYEKLDSYYLLWKYGREFFGIKTAHDIVEHQLRGDIYINDFHGFSSGKSYCFNYSTYDIAVRGLPMVKSIKSIRPKYLYSFKSQVEQFVVIASNSTLGATGLADLLLVMSFYVEDILDNKGDSHFKFASEEDCWSYIKETLVSMIYTLNQPMRSMQCVTEDTEVLTPNGFKKYYELKVGDDIYTWKEGIAEIQKVRAVSVSDYEGFLHEYRGRDIVQTVTPNHKVLHKKNNSQEVILSESQNIFNCKTPLNIPIAMDNLFKDYPISDDWLKICVFILTDGHLKQGEGNRRTLVQFFKSPKRWGIEEFEETLENLSLDYTFKYVDSEFGGICKVYTLTADSSEGVVDLLNNNRTELPKWFSELSQRQANLVIDLWAKLDGTTEEDNYNKQRCQCDSYKIVDQLQHVCFLAGRGSSIIERLKKGNVNPTIYLCPYHRTSKYASSKTKVKYKGKVWCPTTDNGVVVFRKEGKIFISGNSPFTNISIFDDVFLRKLSNDYIHPTRGTALNLEVVRKLQEIYIDIINEELNRTPLTFPVTSACHSIDLNNNIKDEKFLDFIAEKNLKYGFMNLFKGKSSTLSSCCFVGSQLTLSKSSNGVNYLSFKDLYESNWEDRKKNFTIFHNGSWVKGKTVKVPRENKDLYEIVTVNNKKIIVTEDHINVTNRGDKLTKDLKVDDYLLFNSLPLDSVPERDKGLTYSQGVLIGAYLGDGSIDRREVRFSLNKTKRDLLYSHFEDAMEILGLEPNVREYTPYHNVHPLGISSVKLADFIREYVMGDYSYSKELNLECLLQSREFRQGIIDGYYITDGGNSNRIYSTSKNLIDQIEILLNSLGKISVINDSDRTDEKVVIRNECFNRNYPLYCIRWYESGNKRCMKDVYITINNATYFKIKSISKIELEDNEVYCFEVKNIEEPYFTLPNGIITHNCRLRSDLENEYFNSFGAGSSKIGSLGVVTTNYARLGLMYKEDHETILKELKRLTTLCFKANYIRKHIVEKRIEEGYHPLYSLGFIEIKKQYLTQGVNGFNELLETAGFDPLSEEGVNFGKECLKAVNRVNNALGKKFEVAVNVEQIPAENTSIKLANKDKVLGYNDRYTFYSNQFIPLITEADILDRIRLQGLYDEQLSGGSICHLNVETRLEDKEKLKSLIKSVAKQGVRYTGVNYNLQECTAGHISVGKKDVCECGSKIENNYTRVVGFLTNTKHWAKERRKEDYPNRKFYKE